MAFSFSSFLAAIALMLYSGLALAQSDGPPVQEASPDAVAFTLDIHAPDDIRDLLSRHLELQRYRVMADLSDAEIQTLLQTAQKDASDLVATLGYFSPTIRFAFQVDGQSAARVIRVDVEPGPPTRVREVQLEFLGGIAQSPQAQAQRQEVVDAWSLPEEEVFTQNAWDSAKQQALKQLLARRYAAARLQSSLADIEAEGASASLHATFDSGPAYQIGRLVVQGNQHYPEDLVRRLARLQPGDDYALSDLVAAQSRLTDSGYFDSAYLSLDMGSDPENAVVQAQVKEAALQKLVLGVGASTDAGARWSVEHTHNQVPGIGWRALNQVSGDRNTQTFSSDWTSQPDDSQWRWATSALFEEKQVAEIDVSTQRFRFGRVATQADFDQSYYLQFERTRALFLENQEAIANEAATVNYAFALRRFDSTPFPSRGWGLGGEVAAGSVLGTDQEPYARVLLRWRAYQPLERATDKLFNRQRSGRMVYRAEAGAVVVNDATNVPFTQLFLTGGDSSVRGYRRDEIGVTHDGVLSAESGRYLANASVEWQRPIVRGGVMTEWEGALFVDTGAVANRTEEFSFKVGFGAGARWKSPIGPLQIDLAYGVATQALRLHLNVGFVF